MLEGTSTPSLPGFVKHYLETQLSLWKQEELKVLRIILDNSWLQTSTNQPQPNFLTKLVECGVKRSDTKR